MNGTMPERMATAAEPAPICVACVGDVPTAPRARPASAARARASTRTRSPNRAAR
jgi:hypothetical protein